MPSVQELRRRRDQALEALRSADAACVEDPTADTQSEFMRAADVVERAETLLAAEERAETTRRQAEEHAELRETVEAPETRTEAQTIRDGRHPVSRDVRVERALRAAADNPSHPGVELDVKFAREFNQMIHETGATPREMREWVRKPESAPPEVRAVGPTPGHQPPGGHGRALSTDASSAGDSIPSQVERMIEPYGEYHGGLIDVCRQILTPHNQIGNITIMKQTGQVTIGSRAEAAEYPAEDTLDVDGVTLGAHDLAARSYVSEELLASTVTNIQGLIGADMRDAIRGALEVAVVSGTTPASVVGLIEAPPAGRTTDAASQTAYTSGRSPA